MGAFPCKTSLHGNAPWSENCLFFEYLISNIKKNTFSLFYNISVVSLHLRIGYMVLAN